MKVIEHFSNDLNIDLRNGGKRSLFLVNTVALGEQVSSEIKKMLNMKVAYWSSETSKKTTWTKERYQNEMNENQIIVATAQLFVDAVKHSFVGIDQLNVVIFDECHHGRMNHPYHELMKQFKYVHPSRHPRVIGLSAQLIGISSNLTEETIGDELTTLESTFMSLVVSVNRLDEYKNVLLYSTKPKESFLKFKIDPPTELGSEIEDAIDKIRWDLSMIKIPNMKTINPSTLRETTPKKLKIFSLLFEDVKFAVSEMGIFGCYLNIKSIRIQLELFKRQRELPEILKNVVKSCLKHVDSLEALIKQHVDFDEDLTVEKIIQNSSSKVKSLIGILKMKFSVRVNENFQSLVFVLRRSTAKCLKHLIKQYVQLDYDLSAIKPDFVVGINATIPESIEEISNANENKNAIEKFRMRQTNLIFASSVLEEGMDLQACNLVVMYDYPVTFRAYIQSKGRARTNVSEYVVLVPNPKAETFVLKRNSYDKIDSELKRILITKTCDRALNQEEIERERVDEWQPLRTNEDALMNNISAVALLNRYLSRFGNVNELFTRKDYGPGRVQAILKLPRETGICETIESDFFADIKLAKQNAAFKACHKLYERGQLDEHLLPDYRHAVAM